MRQKKNTNGISLNTFLGDQRVREVLQDVIVTALKMCCAVHDSLPQECTAPGEEKAETEATHFLDQAQLDLCVPAALH